MESIIGFLVIYGFCSIVRDVKRAYDFITK